MIFVYFKCIFCIYCIPFRRIWEWRICDICTLWWYAVLSLSRESFTHLLLLLIWIMNKIIKIIKFPFHLTLFLVKLINLCYEIFLSDSIYTLKSDCCFPCINFVFISHQFKISGIAIHLRWQAHAMYNGWENCDVAWHWTFIDFFFVRLDNIKLISLTISQNYHISMFIYSSNN